MSYFPTPNDQLSSLGLFRQMTFEPLRQSHQQNYNYLGNSQQPYHKNPFNESDSEDEIEQMKRDILFPDQPCTNVVLNPIGHPNLIEDSSTPQFKKTNYYTDIALTESVASPRSPINDAVIISKQIGFSIPQPEIARPILVDSQTQTKSQKTFFDPKTLGPSKRMQYSKLVDKLKCHYQESSKHLFDSILNKHYQPHRSSTNKVLADITKEDGLKARQYPSKPSHSPVKLEKKEQNSQTSIKQARPPQNTAVNSSNNLTLKNAHTDSNKQSGTHKGDEIINSKKGIKESDNNNNYDYHDRRRSDKQIESKVSPVQISLSVSHFKRIADPQQQIDQYS